MRSSYIFHTLIVFFSFFIIFLRSHLKSEGYKLLLTLLSDIRQCFENLINLLEVHREAVSNLNFSKDGIVVEKQLLKDHVQCWIKDIENKLSRESCAFSRECSSLRTFNQVTSSLICSEKQRSIVKLKVATAAVQQESARVYEKTRKRAEEMKRKLINQAEEARRKAEEARKKAEQEVEKATKRADKVMEEVNRQMKKR